MFNEKQAVDQQKLNKGSYVGFLCESGHAEIRHGAICGFCSKLPYSNANGAIVIDIRVVGTDIIKSNVPVECVFAVSTEEMNTWSRSLNGDKAETIKGEESGGEPDKSPESASNTGTDSNSSEGEGSAPTDNGTPPPAPQEGESSEIPDSQSDSGQSVKSQTPNDPNWPPKDPADGNGTGEVSEPVESTPPSAPESGNKEESGQQGSQGNGSESNTPPVVPTDSNSSEGEGSAPTDNGTPPPAPQETGKEGNSAETEPSTPPASPPEGEQSSGEESIPPSSPPKEGALASRISEEGRSAVKAYYDSLQDAKAKASAVMPHLGRKTQVVAVENQIKSYDRMIGILVDDFTKRGLADILTG